jgi:hypothetical protein
VSYVPEMGRVRECGLCDRVLRIVASAEGWRMCEECARSFAYGEIEVAMMVNPETARAEIQRDLDYRDAHK